jgi:hypothetical protein
VSIFEKSATTESAEFRRVLANSADFLNPGIQTLKLAWMGKDTYAPTNFIVVALPTRPAPHALAA